MWKINVNEPERDPYWVDLKPGANPIGRSSQNGIALGDTSASRHHAEILWDNITDSTTIHDLNSTNGTYVNRKRITGVVELKNNDAIRIGRAILYLTNDSEAGADPRNVVMGTHFFTREIVLESLDEHAVMIDEVAQKLNSLFDIPSTLQEVSQQIKRILEAADVHVFLSDQFDAIKNERAQRAIQNHSVEITNTQMCIPVADTKETHGLICLTREADARRFSQRDLGLAVAISHQAALTLNRLKLMEKTRQQDRMRELLLRFVSPLEVDYLLKDYLKSGKLPELEEQKATILFADIANSTGISERIGSQRFAEFLARYYHDVTGIIFRYGGVIKYMGDGIMAAFVSTSKTRTIVPQEIRAVQAGWNILNQVKRSPMICEGEPLVVGLAINTGPAMVGYIGIGPRAEFTVLGDTVNIASRMQTFARPNRLLIGPATQRIVDGHFVTNAIGTIEVRGRSAPVQIHEITGTS